MEDVNAALGTVAGVMMLAAIGLIVITLMVASWRRGGSQDL